MSATVRRRAARTPGDALTPADLETLTAGLASGKRVTVYLREATPSLGLEEGASARVLSVDGTTVTVSPKGIDDQLPYEADELRMTREAPAKPVRKSSPRPRVARTEGVAPAAVSPETPKAPPAVETPKAPPAVEAPKAPRAAEAPKAPPASTPAPTPAKRRARSQPAPVVVTISSGADDVWTVSVAHGAKKVGRPAEVTADRVVRAVRELGDPTVTAAVDEVVENARAAAQQRVEALSRELETARAALERLKNG